MSCCLLKNDQADNYYRYQYPDQLAVFDGADVFQRRDLNIISLSGLALGVGMLVDNSIVRSRIFTGCATWRQQAQGCSAGSQTGCRRDYSLHLTTICVFLPIVFTEGITRQLFTDMGLTIAYSLLASLFVALTLVPTMASTILTKADEKRASLV